MNKDHWNTVYLDGNLEDSVIMKMIDDSYEIVYKSLTKKVKRELEEAKLITITFKEDDTASSSY